MIDGVAAELRRLLAELPVGLLTKARDQVQTSYLRWHETTRGSGRQERLDALTEMRLARAGLDEALQRLRKAGENIAAYASRIEGRTAAPQSGSPHRPDVGTSGSATTEPAGADVPDDRAGSPPSPAVPADFDPLPYLPPPAPRRTRGGPYTKTRGCWVDGDRVEELVSGEHDRYSRRVNQHAQRIGLVGPGEGLQTAGDVELRFAMRMRDERISSAVILLNRAPCEGRYGCDDLLSRFLPPDATLTVYWSSPGTSTPQHRTYRGGEQK